MGRKSLLNCGVEVGCCGWVKSSEPPKSNAFVKIKSVNGEIFSYLPEDKAEVIFQLGGKYQNVEIDAKTAIRERRS